MSYEVEFPAPFRHANRLVWDRFDVENYKRSLIGLPALERDQTQPIAFVTAKQLSAELPYGRRTLGRRVKGRERGKPKPVDAVANQQRAIARNAELTAAE